MRISQAEGKKAVMNKKNGVRKKSPRIVRAWFDTVINPLLAALDKAEILLAKNYWTWEFQPPSLEHIHRVQAYVNRDNLEHLVTRHPDVGQAVNDYDLRRDELLQMCERLHQLLVKSPELEGIYQRIGRSNAAAPPEAEVQNLVTSYNREMLLNFLAQGLVNNQEELPYFYVIAPIWNRYREELFRLLQSPTIGDASEDVKRAGGRLRISVDGLRRKLKEVREALSEEHDVPFVEAGPIAIESLSSPSHR